MDATFLIHFASTYYKNNKFYNYSVCDIFSFIPRAMAYHSNSRTENGSGGINKFFREL